jgi:glycosyltransferase involved in cell wall biosynthesis
VPAREERFGIPVTHPRFPLLPKMGMTAAPLGFYLAVLPHVRRMIQQGLTFDLIDAHYFYPDGVAAALLGRQLGKPVVITARGTDLNLIPRHATPRRMIRWASDQAAGLVTVCAALKDSLVELGVPAERVRVLRNGVDLDMFAPGDRLSTRHALGIDRPILLSVGQLIPRKGHDIVIRALKDLPEWGLLIAGGGPMESDLRQIAAAEGVAERVRFLGLVPHAELPRIYGAADLLVLASEREGWANVLLEAMACGTPVVASNVWGTPEVVRVPEAGRLMRARTPEAVAEAVRGVWTSPPDRRRTRAYAEQFSWDATTAGQLDLFAAVTGRSPASAEKAA